MSQEAHQVRQLVLRVELGSPLAPPRGAHLRPAGCRRRRVRGLLPQAAYLWRPGRCAVAGCPGRWQQRRGGPPAERIREAPHRRGWRGLPSRAECALQGAAWRGAGEALHCSQQPAGASPHRTRELPRPSRASGRVQSVRSRASAVPPAQLRYFLSHFCQSDLGVWRYGVPPSPSPPPLARVSIRLYTANILRNS